MIDEGREWCARLRTGALDAWFTAFHEGRAADNYARMCGLLVEMAVCRPDSNIGDAMQAIATSPALRHLGTMDRRTARLTLAAWRATWR